MRRPARREGFGLIVQPPLVNALVFLGRGGIEPSRPLSAPLECHLSITAHCPNRCPHCYESSQASEGDRGFDYWRGVIDTLSRMRVFHCAVGGGEPSTVPWLFKLAGHARRRRLVPNLTTSGFGVDDAWAKRSAVFGQVNVSFDGFSGPRPAEVYRMAAAAAAVLKRRRGGVGINCVVTRNNFNILDDVCALARSLGLSEVELLRFKPSGRASDRAMFAVSDLTEEMYGSLVKTVERLMLRHRIRIKLDCSFVPAVASSGISRSLMRLFGVSGCEGGNELCAIDAEGGVRGCSFARDAECNAGSLEATWPKRDAFAGFRRWEEKGGRVCLECDCFDICRGGCHVVSKHVTGSWYAPDPSCIIARRALRG